MPVFKSSRGRGSFSSTGGLINAASKASRSGRSIFGTPQNDEEEEAEEKDVSVGGNGNLCVGEAERKPVSVVSLLKECTERGDLQEGSRIHAQFVTRSLLKTDTFVGGALINMYAKCGALREAEEVFRELPTPNLVVWNSLISGYVKHGHGGEAIACYDCLQQHGLSPDAFTFTYIVKACSILKCVEMGQQLHAEIARTGILKWRHSVGTALIDMYMKCAMVGNAQETFDQLVVWNVISWTALIAGYVQEGCAHKALMLFQQMQQCGILPNPVSFMLALKACGNLDDPKRGHELHSQILDQGLLGKDIVLGTALIDMYSKCGILDKAYEVFGQLSDCNVVTWNALISGYVQNGLDETVILFFYRMQSQGVNPNLVTFLCILKVCGRAGRAKKVDEIHAILCRNEYFLKEIILANSLLDTYSNCGLLIRARETFDGIIMPNVVSWNALIAGYVQHEEEEKALACFDTMQLNAVSPDTVTYACILKACGAVNVIERGKHIHAQIFCNRLMGKDIFVANTLVDMYAKCGAMRRAKEVFDRIVARDTVSWTALVGGYAQHGYNKEALNGLQQMQNENLSPDGITFASILRACGNHVMVDEGLDLHTQIVIDGLLDKDIKVGTALMDMYIKCGLVAEALDVFDAIPAHDSVSWSLLITICSYSEHPREALNSFEQMQLKGVQLDATIFASALKACSSSGALGKGQLLHNQIVTNGLFEKDIIVGTALIDMYGKHGMLAEAQDVFSKLPAWNVISWNAVLNVYAMLRNSDKVLLCFEFMQHAGGCPDMVTLMCVAGVCGSLGAAMMGQMLHGEMVKKGLLGNHLLAGNALVDLYANCYMLAEANSVFRNLPRDVISWNAILAGYAQLRSFKTIVDILKIMDAEELDPNEVTFTLVLNACSHGGLLDEGQMMFQTMITGYYIIPKCEHYVSMIDLFCRGGLLHRAEALIKTLPFVLTLVAWHALLDASQKWNNLELGRWAYEHALQLDELNAAAYISMANLICKS